MQRKVQKKKLERTELWKLVIQCNVLRQLTLSTQIMPQCFAQEHTSSQRLHLDFH